MDLPKTINELQKGLVNKRFSAVELVNKYLERVNKLNTSLNAFNTVCDEVCYEQARNVDKLIADLGDRAFLDYPLLGVVIGHKDLFLTKRVRTTASSKVLESYVPAYSGTVVKKLEDAGCILIGKLNCDAWAHGASGENSDFGFSKNPWNIEYVPGGSSSGSASSVSANLCTFATGTDTGGSIRQPASFCNLVGLKPTYGAVSRYGVIAMASSLDSVGHLTRTVEDSQKIFEITSGEDGYDSTVVNYKPQVPKSKLRIGVPKEYFVEGLDREVEKILLQAIEVYKKMGVEVVDISLPNTKYGISVYYIVQPAEVSSNLSRYDGIRYGNDRSSFGDEAKRRMMLGTYVLSAGYYDQYYLKAMKVRSKIIADFEKAFDPSADGVDAIIAPVSPTPPFKIGENMGDPLKMYLSDVFTVSANLAGIPGLAIPGGFSSLGLPIGFQLMGKSFSEAILFELGKKYQKETNWHEKEPNIGF